jgi:glycosyltransferase involved in cell wall biosynthesis
LRAILDQRTSFPFDVIVVDSSADDTPEIVSREFPSVRLIHLERRTFAGAARNIGVRATSSEFCVMIDSDCIASPDLVEKLIARHAEGNYAGVGGSLRNGTGRSLSGLIGYLIEFKEVMPKCPLRIVNTVPTGNVVYRREVFERYGAFPDDLQLGEDVLFNSKLTEAGEKLLFDPSIEVLHLNHKNWRDMLAYQVALGRMSAEIRKRGAQVGFMGGRPVLRWPALALLMPFARLARAGAWLALYDRVLLAVFLLVWPLYLIAAGFWSYGLWHHLVNPVDTEPSVVSPETALSAPAGRLSSDDGGD